MNGTKRVLIIVLLILVVLGLIAVIAGWVLGANPVQIIRELVQQAAERFRTGIPGLTGKLADVFAAHPAAAA